MPAFRTRGSTGVAPTTVWMSYIADKYTMLSTWTEAGLGVLTNPLALPACNMTNLFNTSHVSFGAFTTAPDGTNTAQKIVEDATNNPHYVQAAFLPPQNNGQLPFIRSAFIVKSDGVRTRVAIQGNDGGFGDAITVGFDLAGAQVAYGPNYIAAGASKFPLLGSPVIYPLGSGFYLIFIDLNNTNSGSAFSYRLMLDNGAGTAAQSTSYLGDGVSGMFGWKTSVLPVQTWNITGQSSFDDFNDPTLSNFDKNNTLAPGFDWYQQMTAYDTGLGQGWFNMQRMPPASLSASGSVLRIPALSPNVPPNADFGKGIASIGANLSTNTLVGKGWTFPLVFELKMAYGYSAAWNPGDFSWWGGFVEFTQNIINRKLGQSGSINGGEIDFTETQGGGGGSGYEPISNWILYEPGNGVLGIARGVEIAALPCNNGYPPFQSTFLPPNSNFYVSSANTIVSQGGNFYVPVAAATTAPPSADWTQVFPVPRFTSDFSQQHVWTQMLLSYNRVTGDKGCRLIFFDGVLIGAPFGLAWTPKAQPGDAANPLLHTTDWQHFFVFLEQGGGVTGTGYDMFVDSFKVMQ